MFAVRLVGVAKRLNTGYFPKTSRFFMPIRTAYAFMLHR